MNTTKIETGKEINRAFLTGERPLFHGNNLKINETIFTDGESPLKESQNIHLTNSSSNGNTPSGTAKMQWRRTAAGWKWHVPAYGIRIIFRSEMH